VGCGPLSVFIAPPVAIGTPRKVIGAALKKRRQGDL
jgi:hypothetical protein